MENTTVKRACRKCQAVIPTHIKVDGKKKSLCNRKFCLDCSPYRNHNTSKYDPIERSVRKTSPEYREMVTLSLYKKGLERKCKLIEMSGGGCSKCGYNKSRRALTFHHLDRESKLFGLTLNHLWAKAWEVLLSEWEKCELVCQNCHAEIEDEFCGNDIVARVNAKYGTRF
jgi:hypothetical protein